MAECENCPLQGEEHLFASGSGPDKVRVAFIGEAPGFQEAKTGKVFVGPSGKLLNAVLTEHKLRREDVYVDNAVACRPQDNETPTKEAVKACWPRLKHELSSRVDSQRGVIVPLGNTANQAIQDTREGITKSRVGPPKHLNRTGLPNWTIVPTFHPAACLRNSDSFPHLVADIKKASDYIRGIVTVKFEPPQFAVFDDRKAEKAVDQLFDQYDRLVVDIECGFEKDTEFDHPEQYQMLCVGIGYAHGKVAVIGEEALKDDAVLSAFRRLLDKKKWDAWNGKFDIAGLQRYGRPRLYFDGMLASYALDERPGTNGLKYNAAERLGAPDYDSEIKRYVKSGESYSLVPRPILYRYNAYDVANTYDLTSIYEHELEEQGLRGLHDFMIDSSESLMHMEMEGVQVDLPYLDHLTEHYLDVLLELENPQALGRWVKNPRSWKQVKEALSEMGIETPSTDEEHLKAIKENVRPDSEANEFITLLLQQRREQKLYGTYVKGTRKRLRKGRVHPTFFLHGTTSGRLACRNPNLQNVPRESSIRRLFVPAEGNIFVQADYATIELRVLATLAKDAYLKQIFDEGRDIHNEFSERFYGPNFTKDQRIRTKAFIFGLAYGREAHSIALEFKISEAEAKRQMAEFFKAIPGVVAFRDEIQRKLLEDQDDLITPFGRHRRFWLITKDNQKDVVKEGLSFLPQSTASDINMKALNRLRRLLPTAARPRLVVHDSIMVECPVDMRHEVGELMRSTMEATAKEEFSDFVPFPVDLEYGYSWGDLGKEE